MIGYTHTYKRADAKLLADGSEAKLPTGSLASESTSLASDYSMLTPLEEKGILKLWNENGVFDQLRKKNGGKPRWSFLDGPITANNPMGVHHAWGRTLKDLYQRYKAMAGFDQRFQNGFDCQGLWVEVEVERELGFNSKRDIESYGLEKFSKANRERVEKYASLQTEQSKRLGQWMDWDNSYYTMSEKNNEAIWRFLQKCHENGWLYKGEDAVPWCPRCGTAISHHELSDGGYAMLKHPSVYLTFPLIEEEGIEAKLPAGYCSEAKLPAGSLASGSLPTALLVWTTTPWTLLANVAAAVKPNATYVKVRRVEQGGSPLGSNNMVRQAHQIYSSSPSTGSGNTVLASRNPATFEQLILAKSRLEVLGDGWEVLEEFPGSKLIGLKYRGPFDDLVGSPSTLRQAQGITSKYRVVGWEEVSEQDGTGIVHIAPGCGKEDYELGKREKLPAIAPLDESGIYLEGFGKYTGKFAGDVAKEVIADLKEKGLLFSSSEEEHSYPICWRCKTELLFRLSGEWFIKADEIRPRMIAAAKTVVWHPPYALDRMLDWLEHMGNWPISRRRYWGLALPFYPCECGQLTVIGSKQELRSLAVAPELVEGIPELHRPWIDSVKIKCPKCGKPVSRVSEVGDCWLDAGITPFSTMPGDPWAPKGTPERVHWEQWFPVAFVCEGMSQIKLWFYTLLFMSVTLENRAPYERVMGFMNVVDQNGEPMHKSKGNAIWFDDAIEKMGADVMRWIYCSGAITNNLKFGFEIGEEIRRKFLILDNVVSFVELFAGEKRWPQVITEQRNQHVLDRWLQARLSETIRTVTKSLDAFEHWKGIEALERFIDDCSTWYLRRSRERLKADPVNLIVLIKTLETTAQLLAPFIPFSSDAMYQRLSALREKTGLDSVHLLDWPTVLPLEENDGLLEEMAAVRTLAELTHAARARSGVKLRQPLSELRVRCAGIKDQEAFFAILREEVNVKKVTAVDPIEPLDGWEVESFGACAIALCTKLDGLLKDEGTVREFIRQLNAFRKAAAFTVRDRARIEVAADPSLRAVFLHHREEVLRGAIASDLVFVEHPTLSAKKTFSIDGATVEVGLEKIGENR